MDDTKLYLLPLHLNPEYIEGCIDVLSEEWPRSRAARRYTLEKSSDGFPNLVYIKDNGVVGHSMLSQVVGMDNACFIESVVISKKLRGRGIGRDLMSKTEEHANSIGIKTIYLTTHDKQGFYERVGYQFCEPVMTCSCRGDFVANSKIGSMLEKMALQTSETSKSSKSKNKPDKRNKLSKISSMSKAAPVPPAPPPPPPPIIKTGGPASQDAISWMKKELTMR